QDDVLISFSSNATVEAGTPQDICIVTGDETVNLSGSYGGGAESVEWSSTGDGTFDDDTSITAVYTPGENDLSNGSVTLTLTTNDPEGPCGLAEDDVLI